MSQISINLWYHQIRHATRVKLNYLINIAKILSISLVQKAKRSNRKIILICLLEHLGDVVACEPVSRYLKEKNPNAYIVWGVKKDYRELIDSNPHVDMTLVMHCLTERILLMRSSLFDEVIDLHFHDRFCSLCRRPLMKANDKSEIGLGNYFKYGGILSSIAQSVGLPSLIEAPQVYIPNNAVEKIHNLGLPPRFIAINCTSNANEKNWPIEKWKELIEKLTDSFGIPIYELGLKQWVYSTGPLYKSLCGRLSILETAEVIRRAKLFIGIDSGPAHLANAVGTFGIIMLGNYLGFERYNPFSGGFCDGSKAVLLFGTGSVETIQVDSVFAKVEQHLDQT